MRDTDTNDYLNIYITTAQVYYIIRGAGLQGAVSEGPMQEAKPIVLVISSEWKLRALARAQLEEEGYDATGVKTLAEAVRLLLIERIAPAAVIVDMSSAVVGESSLRDLLALVGPEKIVACLGAFDLPRYDPRSFGLEHVLVRPFTIGDLVRVTKQVAGARRS